MEAVGVAVKKLMQARLGCPSEERISHLQTSVLCLRICRILASSRTCQAFTESTDFADSSKDLLALPAGRLRRALTRLQR